jgi:hypothetical protein
MPSTYSDLKIELIATGEQSNTWGTTTNTNLGTAIEQAIVGKADVTVSSTSVTLTLTDSNALQDARALYLNLSGTPGGAATLNVPAIEKNYIVKNGTNQVVTIKVSGQTGVAVPVGSTVLVYNNGMDVVTAVDHIPSLTLGAALPVASGGTGITSFGTGVATALGQNVTGTGGIALATSPVFTTPSLGAATATQVNITAQGQLRLEDSTGGEYIAFRAPSTVTANTTLTFPNGAGTTGQVLTTDGSGTLSWSTPTGGITTGKSIAMAMIFGF